MTDPRLNQALRNRCLSATDIVKLRHYGGALTVWAKKLKGIKPTFTDRAKERMLAGNLFEAPIFEWYRSQEDFEYSFSPQTMEHSNGWLCATPDYLVRVGPEWWRLVEIKTRSTRASEVPLEWVDQVYIQWHVVSEWLKLRGLGRLQSVAKVACCHMQWGPEFKLWPITIDATHMANLLGFAERWWQRHIRDGEKPEPGHSRDDTDALGRLYPGGDTGRYHIAPDWALDAHQKEGELDAEIKALVNEKEQIRNRIRDAIGGDADGLTKAGGDRDVLWSWRARKDGKRHLRRFAR